MVSPEILLLSLEALSERRNARLSLADRLRRDAQARRIMDAKVQLILSQRRQENAENH